MPLPPCVDAYSCRLCTYCFCSHLEEQAFGSLGAKFAAGRQRPRLISRAHCLALGAIVDPEDGRGNQLPVCSKTKRLRSDYGGCSVSRPPFHRSPHSIELSILRRLNYTLGGIEFVPCKKPCLRLGAAPGRKNPTEGSRWDVHCG